MLWPNLVCRNLSLKYLLKYTHTLFPAFQTFDIADSCMVQFVVHSESFWTRKVQKNAVGISSLKIGHRFVRYPIYLGGGWVSSIISKQLDFPDFRLRHLPFQVRSHPFPVYYFRWRLVLSVGDEPLNSYPRVAFAVRVNTIWTRPVTLPRNTNDRKSRLVWSDNWREFALAMFPEKTKWQEN